MVKIDNVFSQKRPYEFEKKGLKMTSYMSVND